MSDDPLAAEVGAKDGVRCGGVSLDLLLLLLPTLPPPTGSVMRSDILLDERPSLERDSLSGRRSRSRLSWVLSFLSRFDFLLELLGLSDDDCVTLDIDAAAVESPPPPTGAELCLLLLLDDADAGLTAGSSIVLTAELCDVIGLRPIAPEAALMLLDVVYNPVLTGFGLADTAAGGAADVEDDLDDLSRARSRSLSLLRSDLSLRFSSRRSWSSYFLLSLEAAVDEPDEPVCGTCVPVAFVVDPLDDGVVFSLAGLLLLCLLLPLVLLLFSFLSRLSGRLLLLLLPPPPLPPVRSLPGFSDADECTAPTAVAPDDGDALLFGSGDGFEEDDDDDLLVPPLPLLPPLPPDEPNRFAYCAATLDEPVSSLPFDDDLCFLPDGSEDAADAAVTVPPLIFGLPISCC